MAKTRRAAPKFYARSPATSARSPVASERGLVWAQRPDGIYQAAGTGGTFWLMPTPSGNYQTTWTGSGGDQRDLGVHPYGSAVQVAARFDPVQQRRAAENPRGGSLLDPDFGASYRRIHGASESEIEEIGNVFWKKISPSARVVETRTGWLVYDGGKTYSAYWGGQDARQAQQWLRARAKADAIKHGAMSNPTAGHDAYHAAIAADDAWSAELRRLFGSSAGNVRYTKRGEGEPGSELRRLYEAKVAADRALRGESVAENPSGNNTFFSVGQIVRYVGNDPIAAGMEGRIAAHGEDSHQVLVQWAAHERAIRQKGEVAYWAPEWIDESDLKPIRKLTKGFAFYDKDAEGFWRPVAENPLDTSVDGWTHWHGDPPNEVGNLGPGQQVQTADGWWYRQDQGADAGKLYFQAIDPNGPVMLGPEIAPESIAPESIAYGESVEVIAPPEEAELSELASSIPPTEELPIEALAVENPRRLRRGGDSTAWRHTPEGDAKYRAARAEAQLKANASGYDFGVEANDIFKNFNVMMLPSVENRSGYELRVEVVHPEDLSKTRRGHGPMARGNPLDDYKRVGIAFSKPLGLTQRRDEYGIYESPGTSYGQPVPKSLYAKYEGFREQRNGGEVQVGLASGGSRWSPQPMIGFDPAHFDEVKFFEGSKTQPTENPRIPRHREDEMVKDPAHLPNALAATYLKTLKKLGVVGAKVTDSRTILPRAWDYGNITSIQVGDMPYEFRIHISQSEVSGVVSKGVGQVIGQARSGNVSEVIGQLASEAAGEMRSRSNPRGRSRR
jgi:hypothetical protein